MLLMVFLYTIKHLDRANILVVEGTPLQPTACPGDTTAGGDISNMRDMSLVMASSSYQPCHSSLSVCLHLTALMWTICWCEFQSIVCRESSHSVKCIAMICLSTHWIFCFLFFDHLFQFMYNLPDYCFVYNLPVTISINTCDKSLLPPASKIYNINNQYYKIKSKGLV